MRRCRGSIVTSSSVEDFNPSQTPGMVSWHDAKFGVQATGGKVFQWDDRSGNGHHLTQAVMANQPTFLPTGLAGNPTLQFDTGFTIGQWMDAVTAASNFTFLHDGTGSTTYLVFEDAAKKFAGIISTSGTSGAIGHFTHIGFSSQEIFYNTHNVTTTTYTQKVDPPPTGPARITARILDADPAGDDFRLRADGVEVASQASPSAVNSGLAPTQTLRLGDNGFFSGGDTYITAYLTFNTNHSDATIALNEAYLAQRFPF